MGLLFVHASVRQVIFQVQGPEKPLAHHARDFSRFCGRFVIKVDSLAQGVHDNAAILTFGDVVFNFLA
jgi:hypothetical protein